MNGTKVFISDCEVSDWVEGECSKTCGTGKVKSRRKIVTHPQGQGLSCPPLEKEETCNDFPCPIDCEVDDWSEWSECTANCGGGVRERSRGIRVEPKHGGKPCEETEE